MPGNASPNDSLNGPRTQSEATPESEYIPVNEEEAESPVVFFRSEAVEDIPPIPMPVHSTSPCPKRALKSPMKNLRDDLGRVKAMPPLIEDKDGARSVRALENARWV